MDVVSKMPLLIPLLLPAKADSKKQGICTNIPEDTNYCNAMFWKFKGVWFFIFTGEIKRAAPPSAAHNKGIGT